MHFSTIGPLVDRPDGTIEPSESPVVTVFLPRTRRGVLWTVGEVHFLATPLRGRFPELHKISSKFRKWLSVHECVFSSKKNVHSYDYYLQGSVRNCDSEVFALPCGLEALRNDQYFVADDDTDHRLQVLCQSLRLRGLQCRDA